MSDYYYFPGQFKCEHCKEDFDPEGLLALPANEAIDFKCGKCEAVWEFQVSALLNHKLIKGGKHNSKK